jgi:Fe-S oxidoreductase
MSAYADRLEALVAQAADRCTTCGKCFEACPTARESGMDMGQAVQRVGELLSLTREGGAAAPLLDKWLGACDGSAQCSAACPEDINVRQWVTIAKMKSLQAVRPVQEGGSQCRQPLPSHGAGRAAAGQHAASVRDAEADPGAGGAAHRPTCCSTRAATCCARRTSC